jgi:hypothetical protein
MYTHPCLIAYPGTDNFGPPRPGFDANTSGLGVSRTYLFIVRLYQGHRDGYHRTETSNILDVHLEYRSWLEFNRQTRKLIVELKQKQGEKNGAVANG